MFPMRVIVETVRAQHCLSCAHDGVTLVDSYAIVAPDTTLNTLVETVLSALGYPHLSTNARGLIQVNNWKVLSFDQITDNQDESVQSLFKEISSHIVLKILSKPCADSASSQCISEVKQKLLKSVISKHPNLLNTVDNQQIKELITQIISGEDPTLLNFEQIGCINEWLETLEIAEDRRSPTQVQRFNQLFEIPKLEKWFKVDSNPSKQRITSYMNTLNSSQYRKNNTKISYQQICNWFTQQRQTTRKTTPSLPTQPLLPAVSATATSFLTPGTGIHMNFLQNLMQDFSRPKFDFNNLLEQKIDDGRIDGGSDSPSPAEDEMHSTSDEVNHDVFNIKQQEIEDSSASSPDMSASVRESLASSSPKLSTLDLSTFVHSSSPSISNVNSAARSRLMFDPLTELPILEKWFEECPHPTWVQIDQYTNFLNSCSYRENYPHISQHNVKIWFKNRRAKCKRMQNGLLEKLEQKVFV